MKSYASPYNFDDSLDRPADCTCDSWRLDYEVNDYADSGLDVIDYHDDWCGYWAGRVPREDMS